MPVNPGGWVLLLKSKVVNNITQTCIFKSLMSYLQVTICSDKPLNKEQSITKCCNSTEILHWEPHISPYTIYAVVTKSVACLVFPYKTHKIRCFCLDSIGCFFHTAKQEALWRKTKTQVPCPVFYPSNYSATHVLTLNPKQANPKLFKCC